MILDMEVIEELRSLESDGESLLPQFTKMFCEAYPKHLQLIDQCFQMKDWDALEREAHTLKSVCGNVGARNLSLAARSIEYAAKDGDRAVIPKYFEELRKGFSAVEVELKKLAG